MSLMQSIKDSINGAFGAGTVMSMDDLPQECTVIPTGVDVLDEALGIGGLPVGRIIELYGPEMSGKSTILLQACGKCQKVLERPVLYLDYENALDRTYAARLGINMDSELFAFSQPEDLEQGMDIAETYVQQNAVGLIVIDSLAAMMPRAELYDKKGKERGFGDKSPMAAQGAAMASALRRLTRQVSKSNVCLCFINQTRIDIKAAQRGFHKITTPGSRTLKFYASLRVEFKKRKGIKGKIKDSLTNEFIDGSIASSIEARVVKNKLAPPFTFCRFGLTFGQGVSNIMSNCLLAMERGVIIKRGAGYYKVPVSAEHEPESVRGIESVFNFYKESDEANKYLYSLLFEKDKLTDEEDSDTNEKSSDNVVSDTDVEDLLDN